MKQEMMGCQWHQLDHMQISCTSLQTANHASSSSLNFLQAGCSSWHPATNVHSFITCTIVEHRGLWLKCTITCPHLQQCCIPERTCVVCWSVFSTDSWFSKKKLEALGQCIPPPRHGARLTSVTILIHDLGRHQNLIICSLAHCQPSL